MFCCRHLGLHGIQAGVDAPHGRREQIPQPNSGIDDVVGHAVSPQLVYMGKKDYNKIKFSWIINKRSDTIMKKLLTLILCSLALGIPTAFAQSGSVTQYGNTAYDSNGNSYSTYGNTTYCSDGTSYTTYGNTTYCSDGTSYSTYGNTTYCSNGTSYSTYGNTTYGSDGSTASAYGNTVYYSTPDDQDDDDPYNNIYGYGYNNY